MYHPKLFGILLWHLKLTHYPFPCTDPAHFQPTTARDPAAGDAADKQPTTAATALSASNAGGTGEQPVPNELRGPELTFEETGHEKTFLFAQNNTFIQMDGELIQTFQLR